MARFLNPYNFVCFGDGVGPAEAAPGHDTLGKDLLYGSIRVEMKTLTPLIVPDAAFDTIDPRNDHTTSGLRRREGRVDIPATGIKGALRTAHEAVTGSRLGIPLAPGRLGYRMQAGDAADVIPARVSDDGQHVEMRRGLNGVERAPKDILAPALVPIELIDKLRTELAMPESIDLNGLEVTAHVAPVSHFRNGKDGLRRNFTALRATKLHAKLKDGGKELSVDHPNAASIKCDCELWPDVKDVPERQVLNRTAWAAGKKRFEIDGWLFITGKSARNKHDERLFFTRPGEELSRFPVSKKFRQAWRDVIESCLHANAIQGNATLGSSQGSQPRVEPAAHLRRTDRRELTPGQLLYLRPLGDDRYQPLPVSISRQLFTNAPADLLNSRVAPISQHEEASSSDRLFGYVADGESSVSHRGHLRIVRVDTQPDGKTMQVEKCSPPLLLSALGLPKPTQHRFYIGRGESGGHTRPLPGSTESVQAYDKSHDSGRQELRGRKFYVHHRNFKRPGRGKPSNQNRSISELVKPEQSFVIEIEVDGARPDDLGMLLWLLQRERQGGAHLRIGYAKPLGFGSLEVTRVDPALWTGKEARDALRELRAPKAEIRYVSIDESNGRDDKTKIMRFEYRTEDGIQTPITGDFECARHMLDEFAAIMGGKGGKAGSGGEISVSYPFVGDNPAKLGDKNFEGYRWFMANNRAGDEAQALPAPGVALNSYSENDQSWPGRKRHRGGRDHGGPRGSRGGPGNRR